MARVQVSGTENRQHSHFQLREENFQRSSDLAVAKIYLFDMPTTNHFFWLFCSQVGMTMVLVGFSGVLVFGRSELLY